MRPSLIAAAAVVLVTSASACGDGKVDGGDGASIPTQTSSNVTEAGAPAEDLADAGAGVTWTDLYRDLFGPTAPSGCAGSGLCHGGAGESGALASHGYVCATQDGCRASMLSTETALVQTSDFAAPETSTLIQVLRHRTASGSVVGSMPKRSTYVFSQDSIARLRAWIGAGAPND